MNTQVSIFDGTFNLSDVSGSSALDTIFTNSTLPVETKGTKEKGKIEDFGEKIGGAKKDLWKERNMTLEDLLGLTDREAIKFVVKDNVWKKPDYQKMVDDGVDPAVVYLIKKIRDSLPASIKPSTVEKNLENRKKYISFLSEVREIVENIRELNEFKNLFNRILVPTYYNKYWTDEARTHPAISNKFVKTLQVSNWDIANAKVQVEKTGFPAKVETWRKGIEIKQFSKGDYGIVKGHRIIEDDFKTKEEAEKYLEEVIKPVILKNKKSNAVPVRPQLKGITRQGEDYRKGKDVTGEDMLNVFKFRGGEFGTWNTQDDRQQCLNFAYDALLDLANVLNVDPSKISLGEKLGIAFGARGSGRARAHYEPTKIVINLTKMSGAGSLAHEFAHALDDYLGRISGDQSNAAPFLTNGIKSSSKLPTEVQVAWKNLVKVIKFRPQTREEMLEEAEKDIKKSNSYLDSWIKPIIEGLGKASEYNEKRRAATEEEMKKANEYIFNIREHIEPKENLEKLNALHKEIKGIMIQKERRDNIETILSHKGYEFKHLESVKNGEVERNVDSSFLHNAKKIDSSRKTPYWATLVELFARAFECFIYDELRSMDNRSDYLVYGVNNSFYSEDQGRPYPEGKERKKINQAFREFFKVVKL